MYQGEANYLGLSCSANPKGSLCRHLMECLENQTTTPFSSVKKKLTKVRYSECFRVYIAAAASQKTTTRWLNVKCAMNGTTICESILKIVFTSKTVEWFCLHCQLMKWHILTLWIWALKLLVSISSTFLSICMMSAVYFHFNIVYASILKWICKLEIARVGFKWSFIMFKLPE